MPCPICGHEVENYIPVCPHCGTDFAVLEESLRTSAQMTTAPASAPAAKWHKILFWFLPLCLAILCTLAFVLWPAQESETFDNGYICIHHSCSPLSFHKSGKLVLIYNDKLIHTDVKMDVPIQRTQYSMDGRSIAALASSGYVVGEKDTLYSIYDTNAHFVANNVGNAKISVDGTGILFTLPDTNELRLYHVDTKETETVAQLSFTESIIDSVISPDGDSVAFLSVDQANRKSLMVYSGGSLVKYVASSLLEDLSAISNDMQVYTLIDGILYSTVGNDLLTPITAASHVYFNADNSQLLIYKDNASYLYTPGSEPVLLQNSQITPLLPSNAKVFQQLNYPVTDFYEHVYTGLFFSSAARDAVYISREEGKNRILAHSISQAQLDARAENLYYTTSESFVSSQMSRMELCSINIAAALEKEASLDPIPDVMFADRVTAYYTTADHSYVYYISNGSLYRRNALDGSKPVFLSAAEDITYYAMDRNDVFYYLKNNKLYACDGGKDPKEIADGILYVSASENGYVYLYDYDAYYVAVGTKTPKKLYD